MEKCFTIQEHRMLKLTSFRIPAKSKRAILNKVRYAALCLMCTLLTANAFAQTQNRNVTINAVDQPISVILEQIERQGVYSFFYNNRAVKLDERITISADNAEITKVLDEILRGTNVGYSIVEDNIVLSVRKETPAAQAQPARLRGKILGPNGEPVIGATVIIDGTMQGTNTDGAGEFSFPWNETIGSAALTVTYIGYAPLRVQVNNRTAITLTMAEDHQVIEPVVVTALGIRRAERAVTYNVQELDLAIFETRDANLVNSLAGRVAGVAVNASSAGVGGETKIVIRGNKSIASSNNAMYVLDGIPLPSLSLTSPGDSYSIYEGSAISGDGISNFNSDDLSNMTVLAGPSAAALYGYKAANGVVMMSTRQAEKGVSVNYSNNTTFSSAFWMPDFQNTYGARDGVYASWGDQLNSADSWNPRDFFQTGYNTSNSVSLGIGADNSSTYVSTGMVNARGLLYNNDYDRYNVTANHSTSFLKDKMTLSLTGMYMNIEEQNMVAGGQYYNPLIPVYLMSPGDDINKYVVYERYDASRNLKTQYWPWGTQNISMQNPYWIMNRNMFNTTKDRFILGASLRYDIAEWINVSGRARIDYNNAFATQKNYASTAGTFAGRYGRYYENRYVTRQTYADVMVNFDKSFVDGKLTLQATAGASVEDYNYRATMLGGDIATTGITNLFTLANIDISRQSTDTARDQNQAVFATAQIGWDRKVYLDLTARGDWNTGMAYTDNPLIFYPSVGLSGIITDIFAINSKTLSFLKIRGSYAEVGNPISRFLTKPTYAVGSVMTWITPKSFEPERTKSWEAGLDVKLWGNKVAASATYYSSRTFNQVFTPALSSTSTYGTMYINAGRVDNKGIEVKAELNQNLGPVEWNSTVIYSRNRNKIVKMFEGGEFEGLGYVNSIDSMTMGGTSGFVNVLKEGGSMGDIYVNTLKTDEHGYIWVAPSTSAVAADRNNWIYAGNTNPGYTLSWANGFSWNGIRFNFMINARVGGVGVSMTQAAMDYFGVSETTAIARDNGGALVNGARIPAQSYYQTLGGNGASMVGAYYVYSMTNVRLGEVVLGYDVPINKWVPWIKGLNVSLVGRNLMMLYCKAPFDPELVSGTGNYSGGIDYFQLPSTRNIGFSVKLTF